MECTNIEVPLFITFAVLIVSANIASWRMQKNTLEGIDKAPYWKIMFGDVFLGSEFLNNRGRLWRNASVVTFGLIIAWMAVYFYLFNEPGICPYGLRR